MPISVSSYIRQSPTDSTFGVPPTPVAYAQASPVLLTQRGYRFEGYHLTHDADENTIFFTTPQAWLTQATMFTRRATSVGYFDFRAP